MDLYERVDRLRLCYIILNDDVCLVMLDGGGPMRKKLGPFCSITGQRKIAMTETWKRIKQLESEGKPTIDLFGGIFREEYRKVKEEGRKRVVEGRCYLEE